MPIMPRALLGTNVGGLDSSETPRTIFTPTVSAEARIEGGNVGLVLTSGTYVNW